MSELTSNIKIKYPSNKSFGVFFSIFFLGVFLFYIVRFHEFYFWLLATSTILILLTIFAPKSLTVPNKIWFNFGLFLGSIVAPIIMLLVYLTTVLPTGLILRLFGKDPLNKKLDKDSKSYWIERKENIGTMKNQF